MKQLVECKFISGKMFYMLRCLKKTIPEKWKLFIKLLFLSSHDPQWLKYSNYDGKKVFVFLSGFYQNLGDMAITYAQILFLRKIFPNAGIVPIPSRSTYQAVKTIRTFIKHDDLVTILGGGNMDDMYVSLEEARLHVVKSFPNNRIVVFPQTMSFSETEFGVKRREISHKVYAAHKNLTLFVREPNSLERCQKYWSDLDIGFCPDIVLSLDKLEPICERTDVICCLRNDKELNLSNSQAIKESMKVVFPETQFTDTVNVTLKECQPDTYEATLHAFWNRLRKCKVVVTDRLHCMIFCVITGTPCVVLDNSNHKISGVYKQWINTLPNIIFVSNVSSFDEIIHVIEQIAFPCISVSDLQEIRKNFETLENAVKSNFAKRS